MFKKLFGFGKKKKEEIQEEPVEELEVKETEEDSQNVEDSKEEVKSDLEND